MLMCFTKRQKDEQNHSRLHIYIVIFVSFTCCSPDAKFCIESYTCHLFFLYFSPAKGHISHWATLASTSLPFPSCETLFCPNNSLIMLRSSRVHPLLRHTSSKTPRPMVLCLPTSQPLSPLCPRACLRLSLFHTGRSVAVDSLLKCSFGLWSLKKGRGKSPLRTGAPSALLQATSICCRRLWEDAKLQSL